MSTGRLVITGTTCVVHHADGTTEDFRALQTRAYQRVHPSLQGEMNRIESNDTTGNIRVGFDAAYFPRKDGSASDAENAQNRSRAHARKWAIASAIVYELLEAGVPSDHFNCAGSYRSTRSNSWEPTVQLWLNKQRAGVREQSSKAPGLMEFLALYEDAEAGAAEYKRLKAEYGDDPEVFSAIVRSKLAKAQVVAAAEQDAETAPPAGDEMPQE